jgi:hypothetical protein
VGCHLGNKAIITEFGWAVNAYPYAALLFRRKKTNLGPELEKYSEIINNIHGILSIQNLELSLNKTEPLKSKKKHKTPNGSSYYLIPLFYTNASKGQKHMARLRVA